MINQRNEDWKNLHISSYGDKTYYTASEGNKLIINLLNSSEPFLIGKLGETELRTVSLFQNEWYCINKVRKATYDICNNAGFFPRHIKDIYQFCQLYYESTNNLDYLGISLWDKEEEYVSKLNKSLKGVFSMGVLDPLLLDDIWTSALKYKKVVVIHPFSDSIINQYKKRELIFGKNSAILPEFELNVITAIQSIGGLGAEGFDTWFDALEYMKEEINKIDFDVALLGCGAYGIPLGSYIKQKGKQAIHMGGALQLLFGIIGNRWKNEEYVNKYMNKYWIHPSESETPPNIHKIEDGCYW